MVEQHTQELTKQQKRGIARKGKKAIEKKLSTLQRLNVEYVPIKSISPNPYNPNRQNDQEFELLKLSIMEDGFTQPPVVRRDTRQIVDGEHRWRALQALGFDEIPVVWVDYNDVQQRISTFRHNRARGNEDVELTAQVLRELEELGALAWAKDSLQMDEVELNRLLHDISAPEALADPNFSEAWSPDSFSQGGDAVETFGGHAGPSEQFASPNAVDAMREREQKLREAKSEEERQMLKRDLDQIYHLRFVFTGEEATIIHKALGKTRPVQNLVHICMEFIRLNPDWADMVLTQKSDFAKEVK